MAQTPTAQIFPKHILQRLLIPTAQARLQVIPMVQAGPPMVLMPVPTELQVPIIMALIVMSRHMVTIMTSSQRVATMMTLLTVLMLLTAALTAQPVLLALSVQHPPTGVLLPTTVTQQQVALLLVTAMVVGMRHTHNTT
jgi:hypothetical protein